MSLLDVKPNYVTFSSILLVYATAGAQEGAMDIYQE